MEIKNNKAICWYDAETLEEAKNVTKTADWTEWKELDEEEQEIHLTLQEISDGKGVGVPAHLIRIKQ